MGMGVATSPAYYHRMFPFVQIPVPEPNQNRHSWVELSAIRELEPYNIPTTITIRPIGRGTPDSRLPHGLVVDKRHSRVVISWGLA
ncbi:hypothetical protein GCM10009677_53730 [Sphaerisporangium rubeum]